jgi:hypothetical protein
LVTNMIANDKKSAAISSDGIHLNTIVNRMAHRMSLPECQTDDDQYHTFYYKPSCDGRTLYPTLFSLRHGISRLPHRFGSVPFIN